jgi:predicted esterase
MIRSLLLSLLLPTVLLLPAAAQEQPAPYAPTPEERQQLDQKKKALADRLKAIPDKDTADAAVFLHTAEIADSLKLYGNKGHVAAVLGGLDEGLERCRSLEKGEKPWAARPGKSLRGFVSRIDGSVQPYMVVLPASFDPKGTAPWRLDVVLHGRGPTEVTFLQQSLPGAGYKAPDQPFIELHAFGRGNNGWRWAGETDVFEALEQVRKQYPIDPDRTVLRGFSMGGHGAWHLGAHFPDLWAAVSPGAGFTDTRSYLKITGEVPSYQERAWHIYDAVDYALNLFNTPFIAYGGEEDPQLQASLAMRDAALKEGLPFNLIIGPNTAHAYQPDSLKEIMRQLATHTRNPDPKQVKFVTWTLKYNRCHWVTLNALQEHYRRSVVAADASDPTVKVKTENVASLSLDPLPQTATALEIDGQTLKIRKGRSRLDRKNGKWDWAPTLAFAEPAGKRHGLQGPIDDAFTEPFLVVRGTETAWTPAAAAYADATLKRFQEDWHFGFRGELPVKDDRDVTAEDWQKANLVLLGDPASNRMLAKVAGMLPIRWTHDGLRAGGQSYGPECLPVLVYPNPLNPKRYVVINSGHTWTAKDLLASNANLTPKLPDWAVLKLGAGQPQVLAADFFDESWSFKTSGQ